jgi:radical SAM protein with 4Fe4S-binding SPASM domain
MLSWTQELGVMLEYLGSKLRTFFLKRVTNPDTGFPKTFYLETTSICNLRCPACARTYSKRPRRHMEESTFRTAIQEISSERPNIAHIGLHFFGEPLLNPKFFDFVEIARAHLPNTTLAVSSNANVLSADKIDQILHSHLDSFGIWPDTINPDLYDSIRKGGDLKKVQQSIIELLEKRQKLGREDIEIHVGAVLYKNNVSVFKEFTNRWEAICSKYKNTHVFAHESHDWAGQVPAYNVLRSVRDGSIRIKIICPMPFENCVVSAEGYVTPCCYDCDLKLTLGNIRANSIREIWTGLEAKTLRKKLLTGRVSSSDLCYNCHNYRLDISSILRSPPIRKIPILRKVFRKEYDKYFLSKEKTRRS